MAANDSLSDELQCPVCLLVPRDAPIPACPVGHLVCQSCRVNINTCPTCRRPMLQDGTSILANKMIEEIPHPCKYSQFGCEVKKRVIELEKHEARCPERTIKCPGLNCRDEVQIRKYHEHDCSGCTSFIRNCPVGEDICTYVLCRSGESIQELFSRDCSWGMSCIEGLLDTFYLHQHYFAAQQTFAFYVTMAEDSREADKYLVRITLKNQNDERRHLAIIQKAISMDSAPRDRKEVLASLNVMFVPWRQMRGFFKWTNDFDGNQYSKIITTVDILINHFI